VTLVIISSAMMPISDLTPAASTKFWDCAHEYAVGHMADDYTRTSGEMSMTIAQNSPGIAGSEPAGGTVKKRGHAEVATIGADAVKSLPPSRSRITRSSSLSTCT
jgi:hypothetical protein